MNKIKSFQVDHRKIEPGIYLSRIDKDITTYDLRTRKPNTENLMDHSTMHSFEHMFATIIRNSKLSEDIIYFGPMGCQTGFYLLVRNANHELVIELIKKTLEDIINYQGEIFGKSEVECGNYRSLDLNSAKKEALSYLNDIKSVTEKDLDYK